MGKKGTPIGEKGGLAIITGYVHSPHKISNFCVYYSEGDAAVVVYFDKDGEVEYVFVGGS